MHSRVIHSLLISIAITDWHQVGANFWARCFIRLRVRSCEAAFAAGAVRLHSVHSCMRWSKAPLLLVLGG
jgi:hypothetical protein